MSGSDYRRLHILLLREGWKINAKRVYRIYRQENLSLRIKTPKRRVNCRTRVDRPDATRINDCWAMDFMTDELFDGRRIRILTIVDLFTRESIAIEVGHRFRGSDVAQILAQIGLERELPKTIRGDNGPEFRSKALDQWAYANKVTLDFSRPGKPTDNAFIESFNLWAIWPPENLLYLARPIWPNSDIDFLTTVGPVFGSSSATSIFSQRLDQFLGAAQTQPVLI